MCDRPGRSVRRFEAIEKERRKLLESLRQVPAWIPARLPAVGTNVSRTASRQAVEVISCQITGIPRGCEKRAI